MTSPISAQQRSAEESREEFDTRMFNMVSQLQTTDTIFFYKLVSKSMATEVVQGPFAYSLEFSIDFIRFHGKKFDKDVTFLMKDSQRTWPIKLTVRSFRQSKPRVFAYGHGGWKAFLMDNHIKVGDILILSLIRFSHFEVVIGRAPVEVHPGDDDKSSAKWFRNTSPWWNADQAPNSCRVCKHAPPCPRFLVTIRPSSHPQHLSLVNHFPLLDIYLHGEAARGSPHCPCPQGMAVPGRFWELHHSMLECDELQLKGPNKAISMVKAKRTYHEEEEKLSVRLNSGWEAFLVANKLQVGDVLEFFLVGSSCFTVDRLERIEKY